MNENLIIGFHELFVEAPCGTIDLDANLPQK